MRAEVPRPPQVVQGLFEKRFNVWTGWFLLAPDLTFRLQRPWFSASRETWDLVMYAFLGVFKVFVLIFNVVPYLALLITG